MLYVGTVLLRRTETEFWHMSLRKFLLLSGEQKKYNNPAIIQQQPQQQEEQGTISEFANW